MRREQRPGDGVRGIAGLDDEGQAIAEALRRIEDHRLPQTQAARRSRSSRPVGRKCEARDRSARR